MRPSLLIFVALLFVPPVFAIKKASSSAKPASYFVSDKTFLEFADYAYDLASPQSRKYAHNINNVYAKKHPTRWQGTKVIYVYPDDLQLFFSTWFHRIESPFVLISVGDSNVPSDLDINKKQWQRPFNTLRLRPLDFKKILDNPLLVKWYTTNYDTTLQHPKLHPIPLGVGYRLRENRAAHAEEATTAAEQDLLLQNVVKSLVPTNKRKKIIYSDTHLSNSSIRHEKSGLDSRHTIYEKIKDNPLFDFQNTPISRTQQWKKRGEYQFSLSLIGNGFDCFRTWESLILGNIVIIQSSPIDPLFKNLPVIIVKDWSEITPENLDRWSNQYADAFSNPKYREQLTSLYWLQKIQKDIHISSEKNVQ